MLVQRTCILLAIALLLFLGLGVVSSKQRCEDVVSAENSILQRSGKGHKHHSRHKKLLFNSECPPDFSSSWKTCIDRVELEGSHLDSMRKRNQKNV